MNASSFHTEHMLEADDRGLVLACGKCGQRNRIPYERLDQKGRCLNCKAALPASGEPIDISSEEIFDALIQGSVLPVLVDFWAPWCGPCKMVTPEVAKVARAGAGRWLAIKINTEALPEVAQRFRVSAIPLFALFSRGREIARQSGAMPASAIQQFIEKSTGGIEP